ncbi:TetR/AcrR family transcriptional regulator [Gordonia soli]|uniref:TetR/AcrR family transcriptional regulator n=1 Tax=Gordonia soli TaxID=320799 RepID=UPI00034DAD4F|nr:TetR family transcriptional regulator C-terminal domain-containing protein [Gordonia soli]
MPKLIDHEARRAEIAEALWRIVVREGVSAVSIRDVAAEAGISTGSLRHVFADRSELLVYSMDLIHQRVGHRIAALPQAGTPAEQAMAALAEVLPLDDRRTVEMRVNLALVTDAVSDPALARAALSAHHGLRSLCRVVLNRLADAGLVADGRDLDVEAARLHAVIDGIAFHLVLGDNDSPGTASAIVEHHLRDLAH